MDGNAATRGTDVTHGQAYLDSAIKVERQIGREKLTIQTGLMARQADGAVLVTYRDSVVLVAVSSAKPMREQDFFPLTVDYRERTSAAGKFPGGFIKRETRPSQKEILTARCMDRPIRPLFAEGYKDEVEVMATVISADPDYDPDVLAMIGGFACLHISKIPFLGPAGSVRVGMIDGQPILFPTDEERKKGQLELIVAAHRTAVAMVEAGATGVSEEQMLTAIRFGYDACQQICDMLDELQKKVGQKKLQVTAPVRDEATFAKMKSEAWKDLRGAILTPGKYAQKVALKEFGAKLIERHAASLAAGTPEREKREKELKSLYSDLVSERVRAMILEEDLRADGRGLRDVRPIRIALGVLPRVHGTALFTRGETQSLTQVTLGTQSDEQRVDGLREGFTKRFYLDYNFPPFSVNEVKPIRGPGRREIGHGVLAERALRAVLPADDKFPYTIRVVSDILESNGSSSMATVCAGALSLMDAGVPISAPVAGIAMGLIKEQDRIAILSDILGDEDHLGDMDFKVCGTAKGITSIQMDIKITGVDRQILTDALNQAREGRLHILSEMSKAIEKPRADISKYAPKITTIRIPVSRIKDVIGPGGKVIKDIIARTGASIDIQDDGQVAIASPNSEGVEQAIKMIRALTQEAEVGKTYLGTVRRIMEFGAFVEIFPGTDGLVHISDLANTRVKKVEDVLKEGDEVLVKVVSVDRSGKIRLSRKEALAEQGGGDGKQHAAAGPKA